jgi:Flp pilus assembly protein TadD
MCQWLPLYELSSENVESVIATFSDDFPYTTLWQTTYDAVLIGSNSEIRIDSRFGARLGAPAVAHQLALVGLDDPPSFPLELTLDGPGVERFAEGARRNTDDNLYLEFSSPLSIGTPEVLTNIRAFNRERATLEGGRDQEGVNALAKAVETMPSNLEANYHLASALTYRVQPGRALEFFEATERIRPPYAHAYSDHGFALMKLGRNDEALEVLSRSEEIRPQFAHAAHHRALVLLREGLSVEAEAEFRTALRLESTLPNLHINYAVLLTDRGRFAEAVTVLEHGRALSGPDVLHIERRLAWLLATAPDAAVRDGPRAVGLARSVNEATGDRIPHVIDTLAASLAENGAFEQAA